MGAAMIRAGVYLRISADPEGTALGVERQEEDCRALAKRRGWNVERVYADNDITATGKRRRPAWEQLLADLNGGKLDAIAAYSSSRFYRNLRDLLRLEEAIRERGAEIATVVSGDLDLTTADGWMIAHMLAVIDAAEAKRTSERRVRQNRQKREAAAAQGKTLRYAGRRRAFGYSADGHKVDRREAKLLKDAVRRIIAGESAYRITMEWNAAGVTTPYGGRWQPSKLARTLRGEHLLGTSDTPALVSRDEHELLITALARDPRTGESRHVGRPGRPSGRRYAAVQLLTCGLCGAKLTGRSGHYICGACGKIGVKATPVEMWLVSQILEHAPDGPAPELGPEPADVEPLLAAIRELDDRYAEVEKAIFGGDMPATAGGRILAGLDDKRLELQRQIAANLPDRRSGVPRISWPGSPVEGDVVMDEAFMRSWEDRTLSDAATATLQDFLRQFIAEAKVGPRVTGTGRAFNPARVEIIWAA